MGRVGKLILKTTLAAMAVAIPGLGYCQTREEINRQPVTPVPRSAGEAVTVDSDIERAPCPLASAEFQNITLTLRQADFANLRSISPDLLKPAYQRFIGQTIPLATVCEIRDAAATILRRNGYLAAVQVPPQTIDSGIVRFDVLLAKVVDFQVRGNAGKAEHLIAGYLNAIKQADVFNIIDAERYLLLARDIPGYNVRLTLRPAGTVPGEVIGEVLVEYTPIEAETNFQNYGSHETGRIGGLAQIHFNGLFGAGDRTTFGYFATADFKEQHVVQASEEVRIGREGLTLSGSFAHAWTRPSIDPTIDLRSKTWVGNLELRYPLLRSQSRNVLISGGLDAVDQRVRFATTPLTTDRIRVVYARLNYDSLDPASLSSRGGYSAPEPRWRFGGSVEARQGIGFLGNSKDCGPLQVRCANPAVVPISRLEADTTAFVTRGTLFGEYRPVPLVTIAANVRAQYAPNPLLSYEEFSAGNFTTGRGYDPGVILGDSGVGITGELRYGSLLPRSNKDLAWQIYAFADAAWVWNKDLAAVALTNQRLVSAGGGVRLSFGDRATLDVGAAVPLQRAGLQAARSDVRLLANLTIRLLPWKRR